MTGSAQEAGGSGQAVVRASALALVLVLAALTAVWGAFLVPLRVLGVPVPVAVVVALVSNVVLGVVGGRLYGRWGAAAPGLVWFTVAVALQTRRPEGDLVVPGSLTGLAFLLLGSIGAAVAVGVSSGRGRTGTGRPPAP